MSASVTLTFVTGTLRGERRQFERPARVVLGRSRDCDVQLPSTLEFQRVSRHHCVLDVDPPQVQVRDLGSRNGTLVNGVSVGQRDPEREPGGGDALAAPWHPLEEGDELQVGDTVLRVHVGTPAASPQGAPAGSAPP
jgi:eukaryotic-like serine/threonine-protein kinase